MLDLDATGNFINLFFDHTCAVPLLPCNAQVAFSVLDGRPPDTGRIHYLTQDIWLTSCLDHHEVIQFFAINSPHGPVILGLPWLERHGHSIIWSLRQQLFSSTFCVNQCLRNKGGRRCNPEDSLQTRVAFTNLKEAFSMPEAGVVPS